MSKVTVYSAAGLTETDIQKIRYIMRKAPHKDNALSNIFPERFDHRDDRKIYFDKGKRRYFTEIDCSEA